MLACKSRYPTLLHPSPSMHVCKTPLMPAYYPTACPQPALNMCPAVRVHGLHCIVPLPGHPVHPPRQAPSFQGSSQQADVPGCAGASAAPCGLLLSAAGHGLALHRGGGLVQARPQRCMPLSLLCVHACVSVGLCVCMRVCIWVGMCGGLLHA